MKPMGTSRPDYEKDAKRDALRATDEMPTPGPIKAATGASAAAGHGRGVGVSDERRSNATARVEADKFVEEARKGLSEEDSLRNHDFSIPKGAVRSSDGRVTEKTGQKPANHIQAGGKRGTRAGDKQSPGEAPTVMDQVEMMPEHDADA